MLTIRLACFLAVALAFAASAADAQEISLDLIGFDSAGNHLDDRSDSFRVGQSLITIPTIFDTEASPLFPERPRFDHPVAADTDDTPGTDFFAFANPQENSINQGLYWLPNIGGNRFAPLVRLSSPREYADGIGVADFDNDGRLDIVTLENKPLPAVLSLFLGMPGGFGVPPIESPTSILGMRPPVDLDGDGNVDLLSDTLSLRAPVVVLYGRGDGTFEEPVDLSTYTERSVAIDLDDDGLHDLVGVVEDSLDLATPDGWYVRWNLGQREFSLPELVVTLRDPHNFWTRGADVDGDGLTDLIVHDASSVAFVPHGGPRTFAPVRPIAGIDLNAERALGDIDGDGDPDLVAVTRNEFEFALYLNDGGGSFSSASTFPSPFARPAYVSLVDVEGDGDLDLVTNFSWLRNRLQISAPPNIDLFAANPGELVVGESAVLSWDVAGADTVSISPGFPDLDPSSGSVPVQPGQSAVYTLTATNANGSSVQSLEVTVTEKPVVRSFTASPSGVVPMESEVTLEWEVAGAESVSISPDVGSVTGSSARLTLYQTTTFTLRASNPSGITTATLTVEVDPFLFGDVVHVTRGGGPDIRHYTVADFDGNGITDLVFSDTERVALVTDFASPRALAPRTILRPRDYFGSAHLAAGDFDGDGDADLVALADSGDFYPWENVDGALVRRDFLPMFVANSPAALVAADLDGNLSTDLVYSVVGISTGTSPGYIAALLNPGTGEAPREPVIVYQGADFPVILATSDLDGDGDLDLVASDLEAGFYWFANDGSGSFSTPAFITSGSGDEHALAAGDLDLDGWADLVVWTGTDEGGATRWLRNLGSGSFAPPVNLTATTRRVDTIAILDPDSDGDLDIVSGGASDLVIHSNDGSGNFTTAIRNLGIGLRAFQVADLDSDGDADIIAHTHQTAIRSLPVLTPRSADPPVIEAFHAYDTALTVGSTVRLGWSVSGKPQTLVLNPGGIELPVISNEISLPFTTGGTYTLTAINSAGQDSRSVNITAGERPFITSLSGPQTANQGEATTLTWATTDATAASLAPAPGGVDTSGSTTVFPIGRPRGTVVVPFGSGWKFPRRIPESSSPWTSDPELDESDWIDGTAPLGLGSLAERTRSPGGRSNFPRPSGQFRKVFHVDDPDAASKSYQLQLRQIGAAAVYLNGTLLSTGGLPQFTVKTTSGWHGSAHDLVPTGPDAPVAGLSFDGSPARQIAFNAIQGPESVEGDFTLTLFFAAAELPVTRQFLVSQGDPDTSGLSVSLLGDVLEARVKLEGIPEEVLELDGVVPGTSYHLGLGTQNHRRRIQLIGSGLGNRASNLEVQGSGYGFSKALTVGGLPDGTRGFVGVLSNISHSLAARSTFDLRSMARLGPITDPELFNFDRGIEFFAPLLAETCHAGVSYLAVAPSDAPVELATLVVPVPPTLVRPGRNLLAATSHGGSVHVPRYLFDVELIEVSGKPAETYVLTATNPFGSVTRALAIDINAPPLVTTAPALTVEEGSPYYYTIAASDLDGDLPLTISAAVFPAWLSLVDHGDGTATLTGIPDQPDIGANPVILAVADSSVGRTVQSFEIDVAFVNDTPTTTGIADVHSVEDAGTIVVAVGDVFMDEEDGPTSLALSVAASDAHTPFGPPVLDGGNLILETLPDRHGSATFKVTATDSGGLAVASSFTVVTTPVNDAPRPSIIPDITAAADGSPVELGIAAFFFDPDVADGDIVTYSIVSNSNASIFTSLDASLLDGELKAGFAPLIWGTSDVIVRATDSAGATGDSSFAITLPKPASPALAAASPPVLDRQTGKFTQRVTLTNSATRPIAAVTISAGSLATSVSLIGGTAPAGSQPASIVFDRPIDPGASVELDLQFFSPTRSLPGDLQLRADVIVPPASTSTAVPAPRFEIDRVLQLPDRSIVVEFDSYPGDRFQIQFHDGDGWHSIPGTITAGGTRIRWVDRGPPATPVHPAGSPTRFYRAARLKP